jgi:meso-butanediol dehydrogenase/(S,S)-butanediol dehydrogenase/diacetyl reductase
VTTELDSSRAIVTGAGRGIGLAIAKALAEKGAAVALVARTSSEIEAAAASIRETGATAAAFTADVGDDDSVSALADAVPEALGGPIDIVVNNAGIYIPNKFHEYEIDQFAHTMNINVLGSVRVTQAFIAGMIAAERGRIINIASTAGKYGSMNQSAYNASKHALVGLTKCLALEYAAQGIRANAICPGFVRTDLITDSRFGEVAGGLDAEAIEAMMRSRTPIGRLVEPEEVAALAVYLASPASDAMTGMGLTLAGGLILV